MSILAFSHPSPLFDRLGSVFRGIGEALVLLAQAGPRSEALNRLTYLSDEELEARGTTRDAEIRRIVGVSAHL
jgi:hypothetical protein